MRSSAARSWRPRAQTRLHSTTLYNSIYRFDVEMLVSLHVHGLPAAHAPLLHLRQLSEAELFLTYASSFERIWSGARSGLADDALRTRLDALIAAATSEPSAPVLRLAANS